VRTHFHDATVVMIAHRLLTIADVNQVILLSGGLGLALTLTLTLT